MRFGANIRGANGMGAQAPHLESRDGLEKILLLVMGKGVPLALPCRDEHELQIAARFRNGKVVVVVEFVTHMKPKAIC